MCNMWVHVVQAIYTINLAGKIYKTRGPVCEITWDPEVPPATDTAGPISAHPGESSRWSLWHDGVTVTDLL